MARNTNSLAPWADLMPSAGGNMTVDDLLNLPDDGWQYELIEGRLVRMPGSGGGASAIAMRLGIALGIFVQPRGLGTLTGADGTFDLTQPGDPAETALVPDLAFVTADRVPSPHAPKYLKAWRLAPDLAVEVASPDQWRPEMKDKAERYIKVGVRLMWGVWPTSRQVDVWRTDAEGAPQLVATLKRGDSLDGLDVLPDFTYSLADLFA